LVAEALEQQLIPELGDYSSVRREVRYGVSSRIDFLLTAPQRPPCYLEIKNVHLMRRPRLAEFPDCVTERGAKHLRELVAMRITGARTVLLFVIQIGSADSFAVARDIDRVYAEGFRQAREQGVEMLAWRCNVEVDGVAVAARVPITLS
jgi:sugar fermentation stimulation protein A